MSRTSAAMGPIWIRATRQRPRAYRIWRHAAVGGLEPGQRRSGSTAGEWIRPVSDPIASGTNPAATAAALAAAGATGI